MDSIEVGNQSSFDRRTLNLALLPSFKTSLPIQMKYKSDKIEHCGSKSIIVDR